jgi:hypothetical protein
MGEKTAHRVWTKTPYKQKKSELGQRYDFQAQVSGRFPLNCKIYTIKGYPKVITKSNCEAAKTQAFREDI